MKTLNVEVEAWAKVVPDAFLDGSIVQARNVIEMAVQDIAALAAELAKARQDIANLRQCAPRTGEPE
jgi:Tfp pilus assembly protein PilN